MAVKYAVRRGDTAWGIASKYGVSLRKLRRVSQTEEEGGGWGKELELLQEGETLLVDSNPVRHIAVRVHDFAQSLVRKEGRGDGRDGRGVVGSVRRVTPLKRSMFGPENSKSVHIPPASEAPALLPGGTAFDRKYAAPAPRLCRTIWQDESQFEKQFVEKVGRKNVEYSSWVCGEDKCERKCKYFSPKKGIVREHQVEQEQTYTSPFEDGGMCVVDFITRTPHVPFGDRFVTHSQYVITQTSSEVEESSVNVSWETQWVGRKPYLAPAIKRSTRKGIQQAMDSFGETLKGFHPELSRNE